MGKLEIGEQYLNVQILGSVKVLVFKNKQKTKPSQPDYIGNGVCIWIAKKKAPVQTKTYEEDIL